jgi:hypothetical protein
LRWLTVSQWRFFRPREVGSAGISNCRALGIGEILAPDKVALVYFGKLADYALNALSWMNAIKLL